MKKCFWGEGKWKQHSRGAEESPGPSACLQYTRGFTRAKAFSDANPFIFAFPIF